MGLRPATLRNTLLAIPLAFGAYPFMRFIADLGYLVSPPDTAGSSVGSSSVLRSIKEGSRFTFDRTADKERPVISSGYVAGWSISVLLSILY